MKPQSRRTSASDVSYSALFRTFGSVFLFRSTSNSDCALFLRRHTGSEFDKKPLFSHIEELNVGLSLNICSYGS